MGYGILFQGFRPKLKIAKRSVSGGLYDKIEISKTDQELSSFSSNANVLQYLVVENINQSLLNGSSRYIS